MYSGGVLSVVVMTRMLIIRIVGFYKWEVLIGIDFFFLIKSS